MRRYTKNPPTRNVRRRCFCRRLVEEFFNALRWPVDDCAVSAHHERSVHYFWVRYQQCDQRVGIAVVGDIAAEFGKGAGVQHLAGLDGEHLEVFAQLVCAQRILDIFDNVELDVAVAQDVQRSPGFASVGVVIDGDVGHGVSSCSVCVMGVLVPI